MWSTKNHYGGWKRLGLQTGKRVCKSRSKSEAKVRKPPLACQISWLAIIVELSEPNGGVLCTWRVNILFSQSKLGRDRRLNFSFAQASMSIKRTETPPSWTTQPRWKPATTMLSIHLLHLHAASSAGNPWSSRSYQWEECLLLPACLLASMAGWLVLLIHGWRHVLI